MSVVLEILSNRIILAAALAWAIAQGLKVLLTFMISKKFDIIWFISFVSSSQ